MRTTAKTAFTKMRIERKRILRRLIGSRKNGQIKIITGIRRCGKSYLLGVLYRDYLLQEGIAPEQIVMLELDNDINARYRNPLELGAYLRQLVGDTAKDYYVLLDEIQMVEEVDNPYLPGNSGSKITFVDVLLGLKGLVVKAHGNSKANEICNAILQCIDFRKSGLNELIRESMEI